MASTTSRCGRIASMLIGGALCLAGCNSQDAELAAQRQRELETLRAELEEAKTKLAAQETELARLRKDNLEVLRLRNEVRQLGDTKKQLSQQAQTAQVQAQQAQAQVQAIQSEAQQAAQQLAVQQQAIAAANRQKDYEAQIKAAVDASGGLTTTQGQAAANCINQLRQIDGAMQQWALENKKDANAVPSAKDIALYLKDGTIPKCPAGGAYTLNTVATVPTCTIPGHALPQ